MITSSARIIALVCSFVISGALASPIMSQQTSPSDASVPRIVKYSGDLNDFLSHMGQSYGVTIGFEVDPKAPKTNVTVDVKEALLSDVLNAAVKSAPGYRWRERGEGIEVVPVEGSNPFLDTMIANFQVTDVDHTEAVNRLLALPDVQANLKSMGLNRKDVPRTSHTKSRKVSVKLEGLTVRQALSIIASESHARFWIFQSMGDGFFSVTNSP